MHHDEHQSSVENVCTIATNSLCRVRAANIGRRYSRNLLGNSKSGNMQRLGSMARTCKSIETEEHSFVDIKSQERRHAMGVFSSPATVESCSCELLERPTYASKTNAFGLHHFLDHLEVSDASRGFGGYQGRTAYPFLSSPEA